MSAPAWQPAALADAIDNLRFNLQFDGGCDLSVDQAHAVFLAASAAPALYEALNALVVAVTYADPPTLFNDVLCHEARVPVEFIQEARAALSLSQGNGE